MIWVDEPIIPEEFLKVVDMLIDKERLLNEFAGDEEILAELREAFLGELPKMLDSIQKALSDKNAKALEHSAHTLKGAVSNFQTPKVKEAAFTLENQGRQGTLDGADQNFATLKQLIDELKIELATITQK
jgi:HPt (histidine-containing phosphotransfer) domain-containing protein